MLSLAWVVVGYFSFFDLGLGRSAIKFIAELIGKEQYEEIPSVFWTAVFTQLVLGIVAAILLASISPLLVRGQLKVPLEFQQEMILTLIIMSLSLPVVLVSSSFRGALEAAQKFKLVNAIKIPASVMNYVIPVIGGLLGLKLPLIMIFIVLSRFIAAIIWLVFDIKVFPTLIRKIRISKERARPLFSFGGWVTISSIIGPILGMADRFIIGSILSLQMVSYYAPPQEMLIKFGIIPGSLILTLFPAFSALGLDKDREKTLSFFSLSLKYLAIILGLTVVLIIAFSNEIVRIWLGRSFIENSASVLRILAVGFIMNSLAQVPFGFLQGLGRADLTAKYHIAEAVIYLPLLWFLILRWGLNGAAVGWVIRVSIDFLLLMWGSLRVGRITISELRANRTIQSVCFSLIYIFVILIQLKSNEEIIIIFIAIAGYLLVQIIFSVNYEERRWIYSEIKKLF